MSKSRIDAGVPAGGQFTATAHAEPALGLGQPGTSQQAALRDLLTRRGEKLAALNPSRPRVLMAANEPTDAAADLSAGAGTDKDPNSRVEIFVSDDEAHG